MGESLVAKVEDLLPRTCSRSHLVEPQAAGVRFRRKGVVRLATLDGSLRSCIAR